MMICELVSPLSVHGATRQVIHSSQFSKAFRRRKVQPQGRPVLCSLSQNSDGLGRKIEKRSEPNIFGRELQSIEEKTATSDHEKSTESGTIWGAIALITGTSVGAGILALPAETSPAGFAPSATMLVACWAFLTLQGLLMAKMNIFLYDKRKRDGFSSHSEVLSLQSMAELTLGPIGGAIAGTTYLGLSYTLLVAYIAKSAEVLSIVTGLSLESTGFLFTFLLGGLIFKGGTKFVDILNQVLTSALLVFFGGIVLGGTITADWSLLEHSDWSNATQVLPVVFLSLVYHDLVPVLCNYLGYNPKKVYLALISGSLLPLAMLLSWDMVALCMPSLASSGHHDPLHALMSGGEWWKAAAVEAFCLLATATSFIGTALSLSELSIERIGGFCESKGSDEAKERSVQKSDVFSRSEGNLEAFGFFHQSEGYNLRQGSSRVLGGGEVKVAVLERNDWNKDGEMLENLSQLYEELKTLVGSSVKAIGSTAKETLRFLLKEDRISTEEKGDGSSISKEKLRLISFLAILIPPLLISSSNPEMFFAASEAAGAYGMTVLYGIMPPAMCFALLQSEESRFPRANEKKAFPLPGGSLSLVGMALCACGVIASQAMIDVSPLSGNPEVILAANQEDTIRQSTFEGMEAPSPHVIG